MILLVETNGRQLVDTATGTRYRHNRPSVVRSTQFTVMHASMGTVSTLAKLAPDATDAEFQRYWDEAEGDRELAIESFLSAFALDRLTPDDEGSKAA